MEKLPEDFISLIASLKKLPGVGKYAVACYEMLFLGKFGDSPPDDHALKDYYVWYMETHGKR